MSIGNKFRQFKYKLTHDFFRYDRLVITLAIVFCLVWTWGAISSMSRNWELEQRLNERKNDLAILSLEVETLGLENDYYRSEEYQELSARKQQNKKLPGETLVYLPKNSDAAKQKYQVTPEAEKPEAEKPSNLDQWLSFLFGA